MKSASWVKICSNTGLKLTSWRPTCSWRCKCSVTNLSFHTNRTPHFNPFLSFRLRYLVCWIFLWKVHLQCVSKPICFFDVTDPFVLFSPLVMTHCIKVVFYLTKQNVLILFFSTTVWKPIFRLVVASKDSPNHSAHFKPNYRKWKTCCRFP